MISSMYTSYICEEVKQGRFSSFEEGLAHYHALGLKTAQVSDEFKHMPDMTATELKEKCKVLTHYIKRNSICQ